MLTEETKEISVEISENGTVHSVLAHIVLKDGVEIARAKERKAFPPGSDISAASARVKALAALWTSEDIQNYQTASEQGE